MIFIPALCRPINTADCPPADHPAIKKPVQVEHVSVSNVHGGAILLPPKAVEVATIPDTQARQHMLLEEAVVPRAVQVLVAEDKEAKSPIPVHSQEDHQLLVKCGCLHTDLACHLEDRWFSEEHTVKLISNELAIKQG